MRALSTNSKGFGIILIVIVVVVAGLVSGTGYVVYQKQKSNKKTTAAQTNKTATTSQTSTSPAPPATKVEACSDQSCFEQAFAICKPATLTTSLSLFEGLDIEVFYKVIGPKSNGCSVSFRFTKSPNPELVNKDLICTVDNKQKLGDSVNKTFNDPGMYGCEGPLLSALKGTTSR